MDFTSGKQSKTSRVIKAQKLDTGLFSVMHAYDVPYDFFASSVLFPEEWTALKEEFAEVDVPDDDVGK